MTMKHNTPHQEGCHAVFHADYSWISRNIPHPVSLLQAITKSVRNFVMVYQSTTTPHPNTSSLGQGLQLCYYYHLLRLDRRCHYHCSQCKIGTHKTHKISTDLTLRIRI